MQDNSLTFAFCPHCREKEIKQWESIINSLSSILNKEVKTVLFEDFIEEEEKINQADYDIFYADPDTSMRLLEKGYILLGKIKNDANYLCSISSLSYSPEKKITNVALIKKRYFLIPLLLHKQQYKNFSFIFAKDYDEIIKFIKNETADVGFFYTSMLEKLKDEKKYKIFRRFMFPMPSFYIYSSLIKRIQRRIAKY